MKRYFYSALLSVCAAAVFGIRPVSAQDSIWTLERCINYALQKNIAIQQADWTVQQSEVSYRQSRFNRLPSVSASAGYDYNLGKTYDPADQSYGAYNGTNSTNYGINSSLVLYNGHKMAAQIEQSSLNLQSSKYYSARIRESVVLNVLNAYLQILYAQEAVGNAQKQIERTQEQMQLTEQRMTLGIVARSDYLQIKSQLAREKLTLANANRTLTMANVTMMQLLELPVKDGFAIATPDLDIQLNAVPDTATDSIFSKALAIKPQIKEAELKVQSVMLDEKIARADRLPNLSLTTGISTGWADNVSGANYPTQVSNRVSPYAGVKLSIPIFQKYQVRSNIASAKISLSKAQLAETDTRNSLRKEIEQAVADASAAEANFQATTEQYEAAKESYAVAAERFDAGILNSIDYMAVKNEMIFAESNLVQSRYNLIFNTKVIEYYKGNPVSLTK